MRKAITNRISRRSFTGESFTERERKAIVTLIDQVNQASGLTITYVEDGSVAFNSFRKSYGMFKNMKSLLLLKGKKNDVHLKEKIGYFGEGIVLELTDLGFGSCWVGGTFDKKQFRMMADEELVCVIVVGKVDAVTFKEKMMRSTISKKRKPVEERLISRVDVPSWMKQGIEAVRLAPSAVNSQKATFHYDGAHLTADIAEDYALALVDLGIAKRHFVEEAGGCFEWGNGGRYSRKA